MNKIQNLNRRKGQAITEYLILTALIAVGSIAMVQILGSNISRKLAQVAAAIGGEKKKFEGIKIEEKHYKVRDLGDFNEAMKDNGGD